MVPCSSSTLSSNLTLGPNLRDQRGVDAVPQQVQQLRAIELLRGGQLAERGQHLGRTCHAYDSCQSAAVAPRTVIARLQRSGQSRSGAPGDLVERQVTSARPSSAPHDMVVIRHGRGSRPRGFRRSARARTRARCPTKRRQCSGQRSGRSMPGGRDLQHVRAARPSRLDSRNRSRDRLMRGAVLGRDTLARPAVGAVDPNRRMGRCGGFRARRRSTSSKPEAGRLRREADARTRRLTSTMRKKNVGELPHINSWPSRRPRTT